MVRPRPQPTPASPRPSRAPSRPHPVPPSYTPILNPLHSTFAPSLSCSAPPSTRPALALSHSQPTPPSPHTQSVPPSPCLILNPLHLRPTLTPSRPRPFQTIAPACLPQINTSAAGDDTTPPHLSQLCINEGHYAPEAYIRINGPFLYPVEGGSCLLTLGHPSPWERWLRRALLFQVFFRRGI